jgi:hypothetical protein
MYHARREVFNGVAPARAGSEDTVMTSPVDPSPSAGVPTLVLDPDRILDTIRTLRDRIEERFPESSLGDLCRSLLLIGEHTKSRLDTIERPNLWLRGGAWVMAILIVAGVGVVLSTVFSEIPGGVENAFEALQVLESGIQDVVFIGIGLVFLVTAENRIRRNRALGFIRELRAIAHIVDMHQLTKDPDRLLHPYPDTASSPVRLLTKAELGRYLDYGSELLSLTSKLAALYAERLTDSVVLQAVDEVETLTTGLSGKIWQKIMMLDSHAAET